MLLSQAAIQVSRDFMGCTTLKKYYAQLQYLQGRFPMQEEGEAAIAFTWFVPLNCVVLWAASNIVTTRWKHILFYLLIYVLIFFFLTNMNNWPVTTMGYSIPPLKFS